MANNKTVNVHIHNDLGYAISSYWLSHKSSGSGSQTDHAMGETLAQGGDSPEYPFNLVSSTTDVWTVMWTDANGNLFGSPRWFGAECYLDGGSIEVQLQSNGSKVEVLQGSKTNGTATVEPYGFAN